MVASCKVRYLDELVYVKNLIPWTNVNDMLGEQLMGSSAVHY